MPLTSENLIGAIGTGPEAMPEGAVPRGIMEAADGNKIAYDVNRCRFTRDGNHELPIIMTYERIRVGCHVITVDAAKRLLALHASRFGSSETTWRLQ